MASRPIPACVGIGSNVGDRAGHVRSARLGIESIPATRLVRLSSVIETAPVGPVPQGPFLNAAALVETALDARALLLALQDIERRTGRDRAGERRWGPRTLDLDLLLFGDEVIDEPGLTVPHPRMHQRAFVLAPLAEIAPDTLVPTLGHTVAALMAALPASVASPTSRTGSIWVTMRAHRIQCLIGPLLVASAAATGALRGPPPVAVRPDEVLVDMLQPAYRRLPVAEQVTVSVRPANGPERTERFIVRIDPGPLGGPSAGARPRRVLLELGMLRAYLADGRMVVVHSADPDTCYTRNFEGPPTPAALAQLLPPLPVIELALAADGDENLASPTPYTPEVTWTSATVEADARPPVATMIGRTPSGPVTLVANASTGRLLRFRAELESPEGPTVLDMTAEPGEPGDPATWAIGCEGRTPVGSLAELRTGHVVELRQGATVPDMSFLGPDLGAWSLHDAMRSAASEGPGASSVPAVVVLFRAWPDAERAASVEADARAGLEAIRAVRYGPNDGDEAGPVPRFLDRAGVLIDLADFSRERFQRLRMRWGASALADASRAVGSDELLWTSAGSPTIDRFARDADAVVVVVSPARTLAGAIRLDGRGEDVAGISRELRALLRSTRTQVPPPPATSANPVPREGGAPK